MAAITATQIVKWEPYLIKGTEIGREKIRVRYEREKTETEIKVFITDQNVKHPLTFLPAFYASTTLQDLHLL